MQNRAGHPRKLTFERVFACELALFGPSFSFPPMASVLVSVECLLAATAGTVELVDDGSASAFCPPPPYSAGRRPGAALSPSPSPPIRTRNPRASTTMAASAARPHRVSPGRVPTRRAAALCTACFLLGVCVVNQYWAVPEPPDYPNKASSNHSRAVLNQVSQTRQVVMALDRTISDIEMRLAAARAAQMRNHGISPSDSVVDQGNMKPRMFFVMGIVTTFANRKRRDSVRQTWMPQGEHLQRLEKEKGIVIRFVIGRRC